MKPPFKLWKKVSERLVSYTFDAFLVQITSFLCVHEGNWQPLSLFFVVSLCGVSVWVTLSLQEEFCSALALSAL